VPETRVHAP